MWLLQFLWCKIFIRSCRFACGFIHSDVRKEKRISYSFSKEWEISYFYPKFVEFRNKSQVGIMNSISWIMFQISHNSSLFPNTFLGLCLSTLLLLFSSKKCFTSRIEARNITDSFSTHTRNNSASCCFYDIVEKVLW